VVLNSYKEVRANSLFDLSGQVAVVTGGASGIGKAMAAAVAANGARVILADVDTAALRETIAEFREADLQVQDREVDVRSRPSLDGLMSDVAATHGRLDIVFANAGISGGPGPVAEVGTLTAMESELWRRVLDINLTGTLSTIQAAIPHMKQRQYGRIVVTGSALGLRPDPMVGYPYVVSKTALIGLVRQAAMELAPYNIAINAIAPGPFKTNIAGSARNAERDKAIAATTLLKRLGEPHELAGLALLLASPACSFMTGSIVVVDGGSPA
jgi:NAD(P)-dependent dehydrogenase (short-subunit alcohol dehydrogenase family)